MSNTILSLDDLRTRVSKFYVEKSAAEDPVPEQDPNKESTPSDASYYNKDGDDAGKIGVPAKGLTNDNLGEAKNIIPGGEAGEASGKAPTGSGESGISVPADGKEKDESATSGKNPNEVKVANQAESLATKIRSRILKQATGGETPAETAPKKGETAKEEPAKEAGEETGKEAAEAVASDFAEDPNAYMKIASLVMQYEEGREMVNELADREMGKQAALELIAQAEQLEKQAAYEEAAYAEQQEQFEQMLKSASQEELAQIEKLASVHGSNIQKFVHDFEKAAYDAGAEQAAGALDEEDEMIPGDVGGDVSLDEIAEVVIEMVESGEIPPEVGEQVLQELAGEDAGGEEAGMEGGPMGDPMGGEEIPPEALAAAGPEGAEELGKVASFVQSLSKEAPAKEAGLADEEKAELERLRAEVEQLKSAKTEEGAA